LEKQGFPVKILKKHPAAAKKLNGNREYMESKQATGKRKIWYLYVLLGLCIAGIIVFGAGLGIELYTNWQARTYYENLTQSIERRPRAPGAGTNMPVEEPGTGHEIDEGSGAGTEPWEPFVDFEALNERFPGIKAWIQLEGTKIDYPVMQAGDNDFFLSRLPDGTGHRNGSIFLDYRNNADFSDKHTIVYGHMMRTDDMFGYLKYYRDLGFYEQHPEIYIFTPERDYKLVVFAGYLLDPRAEELPLEFINNEEFYKYVAGIRQRSLFFSGVGVGVDDRIVSLATCAYDFNDARLVIVGKLVEVY